MSVYKEIRALIVQAEEKLQSLEATRNEAAGRIKLLEGAGMVNASLFWTADGYLYLNHPMRGGEKRKRQYVGNKPEAVAEAYLQVERFRKHKDLTELCDNIDNIAQHVRYSLQRINDELKHGNRLKGPQHQPDEATIAAEKVRSALGNGAGKTKP